MTKIADRCWLLEHAMIVGDVTAFIQMLNAILMPKGSPASDGFWLTSSLRHACHSSASWYELTNRNKLECARRRGSASRSAGLLDRPPGTTDGSESAVSTYRNRPCFSPAYSPLLRVLWKHNLCPNTFFNKTESHMAIKFCSPFSMQGFLKITCPHHAQKSRDFFSLLSTGQS